MLSYNTQHVNVFQSEKLSQAEHTEVGDGVQARQLRDKLVELEREIERFRGENGALEKLRREREEVRVALEKFNT